MTDDFDDDFDDEVDDEVESDDTTFSVSEVAAAVNDVLHDYFEAGVWVWGEVSGLSTRNGHTYFTLVEETAPGKKAQLSVNLWQGVMTRLRPKLRASGVTLENGVRVRVFGELDFYAPFGRLSLVVRDIDPSFTLGDIALQREELVRRLKESGDYERNRTTELAPVPLRVGLVTSATSAAYADFMHEIEGSGLGFRILLADVRVQGESAVREVAAAITSLGRRDDVDVVAVVRGGGSRAELATFDAEAIALAIARCPVPVLTGIGHEIDTSVADEVSHLRLKTPTACAAHLVAMVREFVDSIEGAWLSIAVESTRSLVEADGRLALVAHRISLLTGNAVARAAEGLEFRHRRLTSSSQHTLANHEQRIDGFAKRIELLDPRNVMKRGWSITRTRDGRVLRSVADAEPGDRITTQVVDGSVVSTVDSTVIDK